MYLQLGDYSDTEQFLALLEGVFQNKLVEDQRNKLVNKIRLTLKQIKGN